MHFKTLFAILLVTGLFFAVSCGESTTPVSPTNSNSPEAVSRTSDWTFGDDLVIDLVIGQHNTVGTLTVTRDWTNLYFTVATDAAYPFSASALHVGSSLADIPSSRGGPIPGKFAYKTAHSPAANLFTYTVPLGSFGPGDTVFFAFHVVIGKETGWAGCLQFPGKNWATYCTYEVPECTIELPACEPGMVGKYYYPGTLGYWDIELIGIPSGYDAYDGLFPGWCVQRFVYAYPNTPYNICFYYPGMGDQPAGAAGIDWNRVQYVLNHKDPLATNLDIQKAIWYFTPSGHPLDDPEMINMVNDALANGGSYEPGEGDITAVMVHSADNVQLVFIEVEVDCE